MISHVCIGVNDFSTSFAFYSAVLATLGLQLKFSESSRAWAGCGSAAECTALYGSAYANVGGEIDPPTPVGNIASAIRAPNLTVASGGQIVNVGNVIGR